jgi:succinyl-diaminopimelate desuccinylase
MNTPTRHVAHDVFDLTSALVAVPSPSGHEAELVDLMQRRLEQRARHLELIRIGNNLAARTQLGCARRLLFAGHVDTVPGQTRRTGVVGDVIHGRGAVDMKGGVAVMLMLAERLGRVGSPFDYTFIWYDREEVGSCTSGMAALVTDHRDLIEADAAVVLEPTDGVVEAGCQGNLVIDLEFTGRAAHTARPWTGDNAIHRAAPALLRIAGHELRPVHLDGLTYRPSLSVVGIDGGTQGNVVPDRCTAKLNFRHAADLDSGAAVHVVTKLAAEADRATVVLASPPAAPCLDDQLLAPLVRALPVRPKLGWTDVGRLAQLGIPALNFGPGDPELAHAPDEHVNRADLVGCLDTLTAFGQGGLP